MSPRSPALFRVCPLLPIFPVSRPASIFGTMQLNFCVRYGYRWTLHANGTDSLFCFLSGLLPHLSITLYCGGDDGIRTHDPLLAGQVLSQLSYTPRPSSVFLQN